MYKALIVLAIAGVASAGVLDYHVGATQEQTYRGPGGFSSISHQAKNVNSAFSTSSAYKTKVTNNAVAYAAPAYAAPAFAPAYAPVAHAVAAPAYAPVQYASPIAHHAIAAPAYAAPAYHAPAYAHALPVAHHAVAAPVAKLGVAYSPAIGASTISFDGFGVHYGY